MEPLRVSEHIVAVSEFKAQAADWLRRAADTAQPVVITQNGKAAGVLLSPRVFDDLMERARFVAAVDEGLSDVKAGRMVDHEEVVKEVRSRFGHRLR